MTALDPQRRVIAVANGKGGTGKTSVSSGLAGELASGDVRVLAVDLDPLGGLARDFGVTARGGSDDGIGLVSALIDDKDPPLPRQEVRPNLDLITGGIKLEILVAYASTQGDTEWLEHAGARIGELAGEVYDFVIIDTPPGDAILQRLAMYAARWLIVPVRTDMGSWDGLRTMGRRVRTCRQVNPELDYLGAVIFGNPTQATGLLARTQSQLGQEIGGVVPLFDTSIRHSAAAVDARNRGQLASELARDADVGRATRMRWLRARRKDPGVAEPDGARLPQGAGGLAEDYRHFTADVLRRLGDREATVPIAAGAIAEQR